jgi:DNA-binding CsgD family transcriptional regulator
MHALPAKAQANDPAHHPMTQNLTTRERQVMQLVAGGLSSGEIAAALALSLNTVQTHIRRIYRKTGLHNRAGAAAWWCRNGETALPPASELRRCPACGGAVDDFPRARMCSDVQMLSPAALK